MGHNFLYRLGKVTTVTLGYNGKGQEGVRYTKWQV